MIQMSNDSKVAIAYHHLMHDIRQGSYKPNPQWDAYTTNLLSLLLSNLPHGSADIHLADIGSGAGKWSALLSPSFNLITSIEPNDALAKIQSDLIERLKIGNVKLCQGSMPDCIKTLTCDAALLAESIYLTGDWCHNLELLLANPSLRWLAIADGPDDQELDASGWNTPHGQISNRKPLVQGDEWVMLHLATERGWTARLFDIQRSATMFTDDVASRWLLILER